MLPVPFVWTGRMSSRDLLLLYVCLPVTILSADLLQQAGNTDDDRERRALIVQFSKLPSLNDRHRQEAASLAEFARKWNESSLKFYGASMRGKPHRAIGDYDFGVAKDSPLRPICELYRGRMLAWTLIENTTVRTNPKEAKWFKDEAVAPQAAISPRSSAPPVAKKPFRPSAAIWINPIACRP